jgi:hypothetical protein
MLATGFVLGVVAAGVGWTLYFLEKQKVAALEAKVAKLEAELAELRATQEKDKPLLAAIRDELEKTTPLRAKNGMLTIKKAYETFYTQQFRWPQDRSEVYPLLEQGQQAFQSPWPGVMYQVQIQDYPQPDGSVIERPVVNCQPPGKPVIAVPYLLKGK